MKTNKQILQLLLAELSPMDIKDLKRSADDLHMATRRLGSLFFNTRNTQGETIAAEVEKEAKKVMDFVYSTFK